MYLSRKQSKEFVCWYIIGIEYILFKLKHTHIIFVSYFKQTNEQTNKNNKQIRGAISSNKNSRVGLSPLATNKPDKDAEREAIKENTTSNCARTKCKFFYY